MWIVALALRRPYTFTVFAILILIAGVVAITRTPKDIFPSINIPVVSVLWSYAGMSPEGMESHIVSQFERGLTTTVDNIEHIESQSIYGIGIVKVFLQPGASVASGIAQITSISQAALRQMPPGITPPLVISYTASNVPVLRLGLAGQNLSEQQLNDLALQFVRTQLITVPGAAVPYPYGGKQRYVSIDLNYQKLQAVGMTPTDVVNAISGQNVILPSGTMKIGRFEYQVGLNASPPTIEELNAIPIKSTSNGTTIYVRDVAYVRNGFIPQTNVVRFDGSRATMLDIQKIGSASTLDIVDGIKKKLPEILQTLPPGAEGLHLSLLTDQSIFVSASIQGVLREAIIAACLTALMILLFLSSWRSTLIICVSIPLSILCSIVVLSALGETINIMTLGGMALAVGILVDDATVEIENIHRNMAEGGTMEECILNGAAQIAVPAFVSTLCICIVFVPIFFLSGVARFLFVPLAEAVVFAMLASYLLSRTVVPTFAKYLLPPEMDRHRSSEPHKPKNVFGKISQVFENGFSRFREGYRDLLSSCLRHPKVTIFVVLGFSALSLLLYPFLGEDFFPTVDAGRFTMHVRMKPGTRVEETARSADEIEKMVRKVIPASQLEGIIDNLGIPYSGINLSYNTSGTTSAADGDILVSLKEQHSPTNDFVREIRRRMPQEFPDIEFWFPPADIVAQILNFGLPAPIDVQVQGLNKSANFAFASHLMDQMRSIPGLVDLRIQEPNTVPQLDVTVDRTKASILGMQEQNVANSVLGALAGSQQVNPNFWVDPKNGVTYSVTAQEPQYQMDSLDSLRNLPILGGTGQTPQILANVADISRSNTSAVVDHYDIRPVINIYGNVDGKDLGYVSKEVQRLVDASKKDLPRGSLLIVRGQTKTMQSSFSGLYWGLAFSIVLIYLLVVVNFQSWTEPFIIITALPCAIAGIVWMLFLTGTTVSVPALMGTIMCMGVATSNSVLVITFANEKLHELKDSYQASLQAGYIRVRPVIMTALAMIIGMIPMALGLGEGGEQNAPLGRAVIGGLILATVGTLFFVPTVFMMIRRNFVSPEQSSTPEAAKPS
ncbi:MAG TPA: efflux RND transporter permease subunit [Chthoniobacterales bacterium]|jgi:multidrug efflux pump subunit AcrB|nr:efflux RND transporter permease subunit [Chthoniobacterales bacterium]